jgi:hypothetical protein
MERKITPQQVAAAIPMLEALGFVFSLDWDESVICTAPESISAKKAVALCRWAHIKENGWHIPKSPIVEFLKDRGQLENARIHGGSFDGQPTMRISAIRKWSNACQTDFVVYQLSRANWEVYLVKRDMRAFFVGTATSKTKAVRMFESKFTKAKI